MARVAMVGAGMGAFGTRPESPKRLFAEAVSLALASVEKGMEAREVQEAWIGSTAFGGWQLGNTAAYLAEQAGLPGIPARRVENACASSGFALRDAVLAVRSGACDVALVGGFEKMNDVSGIHKRYWLGVSGDTAWERMAGATFPGVYAMMAARHMHEFGTTREDLARVAVKNHANGARNPKAQFQKPIALEKALASPMVASPLSMFDCCSTTDGAAAVLLASERVARRFTDTPVWVDGSGAGTDFLAVHDRPTMTTLDATRRAAERAYGEARVAPGQVDVAEVHDCFTIAEVLAIEDLGFAPKGKGGREGPATKVKVNTSGGLKAKGHPLGATGAGQAVEAFEQLQGRAGARQVQGAEVALTHNVGGSGATCAVHVFRRG
ncbi:MAG TPA: thiolase domain-containing protein [Candidatus Thermoplasmatota archaeon]|nr:thiolase domain-containing protein [Candidatus Thermoplasmatota archaeon]